MDYHVVMYTQIIKHVDYSRDYDGSIRYQILQY